MFLNYISGHYICLAFHLQHCHGTTFTIIEILKLSPCLLTVIYLFKKCGGNMGSHMSPFRFIFPKWLWLRRRKSLKIRLTSFNCPTKDIVAIQVVQNGQGYWTLCSQIGSKFTTCLFNLLNRNWKRKIWNLRRSRF